MDYIILLPFYYIIILVWIVSVKTGIKGTNENVEIQLNGFGGDGGIQILTSPVDDHQSQGLEHHSNRQFLCMNEQIIVMHSL